MNYSPLLTTNPCLYLVLHSNGYQQKLECSEPATNNLLIHGGTKIWKIRKEMAATCGRRFSSPEIGLASASPCRGLHGSEPFLWGTSILASTTNATSLRLGCVADPLLPRWMLKICMSCLGSLNFLTSALSFVCHIKEKPHFSFLSLYSEKSVCNDTWLVLPLV